MTKDKHKTTNVIIVFWIFDTQHLDPKKNFSVGRMTSKSLLKEGHTGFSPVHEKVVVR